MLVRPESNSRPPASQPNAQQLCHRCAVIYTRRYDVDMIFFPFNYSSSLSTSESRAKTPLRDSFECFSDPQRSFGDPLRTFRRYLASPVLKKSRLFLLQRNFPPYYAGTSRMPPRVLAVWAKTLRGQKLKNFFLLTKM